MSSAHLWFGGVVVFCWLAPPTVAFSQGGSPASCQEMIPGHIRAHPLDPGHSYVTVHTSASSYLPGQLITVTVRSSRDFMGFLLQGRAAGAQRRRYGGGAGSRSRRPGPLMVGGSWILTPPRTHTLRCLSEGDTITHSDKQLKRNLSFVWRAPDVPMGDVRFIITVVQSYFIYWAGVESSVVHDGSRSVWSSGKIAAVDGGSSIYTVQEDRVTAPPALRVNSSSKKQANRTETTATIFKQPNGGSQAVNLLKTQAEVNPTSLRLNSSVTLTNHATSPTNASTSGSLQSDTPKTPESHSGESKETKTDPGFHPEDSRSSFPLMSSVYSADGRKVDTTTTVQTPTTPLSLVTSPLPFFPQKDIGTQRNNPKIKPQEPKLNTNPQPEDRTLSPETAAVVPLISQTFHISNTLSDGQIRSIQEEISSPKFQTQRAIENILTWSQTSSVKVETGLMSKTSSSKLNLQTEMSWITFLSATFSPKTQTIPKSAFPSESPTLKSFRVSQTNPPSLKPLPRTSPSGPTSSPKTSFYLRSPLQHQSSSTFNQPQSETVLTRSQLSLLQRDHSEVPKETLRTSPHPQTSPRPIKPQFFTLKKDLKSKTKMTTMSTTSSPILPSVLTSSHLGSSSSSDSLASASGFHPSETSPLHPSFRSTVPVHSSSFPLKNQSRTIPAFSALVSPSPVSTPPHLPSAQRSSTINQPSFLTSFTIPPSNSSSFSSAPGSSSSFFNSSNWITSSNFLLSSASTASPSFFYSSSSPPSPTSVASFPSSSVSSTPTSLFRPSSSSLISSITTPHPGPSSSPHYFLQTLFRSSASSKKTTVGQRLVIHTHLTSSNPEPNLSSAVHQNPKPFPNHKLSHGQETEPKPKRPSDPPQTPDREGKYPEIIPRHSSWELGMLLGCSAGLGMVLVVGLRYVFRQACGRRTEVTLNDREREYGGGPIQVQECGDLVRVRKIRENSFVLLTEYDVLAPPGN